MIIKKDCGCKILCNATAGISTVRVVEKIRTCVECVKKEEESKKFWNWVSNLANKEK